MFAPQPAAPNAEADGDIGQETQRRQQMLRFGLLMFLLFFMLDNKKQINNSGPTNRPKSDSDLPTEIPLSSQYTQQIQTILADHQPSSVIYNMNATGLYRGTWQSLRTIDSNTSVRITGSSLLQLVSLPVRDVPDLSFVYGLLHLYKNVHRGSAGSVQVSLEAGFPLQGVLVSSQQRLVLFSTPYKSQRLYLRIASKQHFNHYNSSISSTENKDSYKEHQVATADTHTSTAAKRRLVGTQNTAAPYELREIGQAPAAARVSVGLGLSARNLLHSSTLGPGMPMLQSIVQLMLESAAPPPPAARKSYPQQQNGLAELVVPRLARNLLAAKEKVSAAAVNESLQDTDLVPRLMRAMGISSLAPVSSREEVLTGLTEHGFLSVILADKPLQQSPPPSHTPNNSASSTAANDNNTSNEHSATLTKDFLLSIAIGEPLLPARFKALQSSATPPSLIAALSGNSSTGGNSKGSYSALPKSGYVPVDCQYTARLTVTSASSNLAALDPSKVKLPTAMEPKASASGEADSTRSPEPNNLPLESVLSVGGSMQSLNCGKEFDIQATSFSLELDKLRSKVDIYALLATLLCLIQIFLVIYQMKRSDTQALVSRISIVSVFAQSLLDANLCMAHLLLSFAFPTLFFASFIWIAVLKLLLFSVFQMRLLINIYQARYSQELSSEGWQGLRARLISLHVRFYGAVLLVLVISVSFYNRPVVGVFAMYSFWVPQIVHSAYYGTKHSLHPLYLIGTTLSRCFIPLYVLGCPDNFLAMLSIYINPQYLALVSDAAADSASGASSQHASSVRDLSMSSFSACWVLVLWLALQLGLLLLQSALGPRFFVPKQWLPQRYDYQRPVPQSVLESLATGTPTVTGSTRSSVTGGVAEGDSSRDTTGDIALTGIRSRPSVTSSRNSTPPTPINSSLQTFLFGHARGGVSRSSSADNAMDGADLETGSLLGDFRDRDQDFQRAVVIPSASSANEEIRGRTISEGGGLECVICYNPIHLANRDYMITPCDHLFHEECLVQWADVKLECPVCRSALPAMADDPS